MSHPHPSTWSYKGSSIRFVQLARLMHPSLNDRSPGNKFQGCNETWVGLAVKSLLLLNHKLKNGKCENSHAIYHPSTTLQTYFQKAFPQTLRLPLAALLRLPVSASLLTEPPAACRGPGAPDGFTLSSWHTYFLLAFTRSPKLTWFNQSLFGPQLDFDTIFLHLKMLWPSISCH